jgi:type II secretory pathway pseudopilin PulG
MSRRRDGFSLLEVLLATSILIGSSIALLELVMIGNRHANSARDLSRSQRICQTKLNEILTGLAPLEVVRPMDVEGEPGWVYWVDMRPLEQSELTVLEVSAAHQPTPEKQSARFSLVRWVNAPRDPADPSSQPPATPDEHTAPSLTGGPKP